MYKNNAVIADSTNYLGKRIITVSIQMPKFLLAQLNKHRVFSSNASSSRAIPINKVIANIIDNPVTPIYWGANKSGMSADCEIEHKDKAKEIWFSAMKSAIDYAEQLEKLGVHKQIVNRILEPYTMCSVLITSTEWDNFFNLRLAHDAQPEMQYVAKTILDLINESKTNYTNYHLPYILEDEKRNDIEYNIYDKDFIKLCYISAARCARVSYLKHNGTKPVIQEDLNLSKRLYIAKHFSCFEHQAITTDMFDDSYFDDSYSGNFKLWTQFRKILEHEDFYLEKQIF